MRQKGDLQRHKKLVFCAMVLLFSPWALCIAGGNLLGDGNFEQSTPDGSFPDSGYWSVNWAGSSGALCTTTSGRSGNGLWEYTGPESAEWWCGPFQDVGAEAGKAYYASAWVRNKTAGASWLSGSRAFIRLQFLDGAKNLLKEYKSRAITDGETDWMLLYFATSPAPEGTEYARFILQAEKPKVLGQSIVNFDDCMLRELECTDCVGFHYVPDCGSDFTLVGHVDGVEPSDYKVGVYIYVEDWWPKPTFAAPWTDIDPLGVWATDITTSVYDFNASEIFAFLVPVAEISSWPVDFNDTNGLSALPGEAFRFASAGTFRPTCFESVEFANRNWLKKESVSKRVGPGPNIFDGDNVWVDDAGRMHLRIRKVDGQWRCAEVFTEEELGYGIYKFEVETDVVSLDPNIVFGFFTWDEFAPHYTNREMDIEISRWGDASNDNGQYVIQPWDNGGNLHRFNIEPNSIETITCFIEWRSDSVYFYSHYGDSSAPPRECDDIESWVYEGNDIPRPGKENVRINLWLNEGGEPADGQGAEVVIRDFEFLASSWEVRPRSLEFGTVPAGKAISRHATITNLGQDAVYFDSIGTSGLDSDNFYVTETSFMLEAGASKEVKVAFAPDGGGSFEASLRIRGAGMVRSVPLTGEGAHLQLTHIPAIGSSDVLEGRVAEVDFSRYRVVVYILTDKWYIKPYCHSAKTSGNPLRLISGKGRWSCDIDVEYSDRRATAVAAFLVPKDTAAPCHLNSLEELSEYEHIEAAKPKLCIDKVNASAGSGEDSDRIVVWGEYYVGFSEISEAEEMWIYVSQADNEIYEVCVPFDPIEFIKKNGFNYNRAGVNIRLKNERRDGSFYAGSFRISLKNVDLTCLRNPVSLRIVTGEFDETAVADEDVKEKIINGRRPIPIQFLSDCADALRIDVAKVRTRKGPENDSFLLKGGIALKSLPCDLSLEDITITWGDESMTLPAGSFAAAGKSGLKYVCKRCAAVAGGIVSGTVDFGKGSFMLTGKKAYLPKESELEYFGVTFGAFSESILVDLRR